MTGPSVAEFFERDSVVFPGRLHPYNSDTEEIYTIDAKQGDSEVLLVEDGSIYYRVSDRLYSARITPAGITTAICLRLPTQSATLIGRLSSRDLKS